MKNQILSSLLLIVTFCVAPVFAQEGSLVSENQCEMYRREGYAGTPISIDVDNTNIRDILNYITKQFGCNFVVDKIVSKRNVLVTVKVENVPWNGALNSILKLQDLAIQVNGSILRVAEAKQLFEESKSKLISCPLQEEELLNTESVKFKNLPSCPNDAKCEQTLIELNRLKTIIARRLSKRGKVEIDESSQTLIITDVRDNLNALKNLVEHLDAK
jgi:type IV pilus assembly protein PilQ